jgi:hypothetical protein
LQRKLDFERPPATKGKGELDALKTATGPIGRGMTLMSGRGSGMR